ncbi:MAG: hypothetical protein LUD84_10590, partial [Clostridiales bacterium]|nr:hypothetical protein [Clostridiales bacterium]
THTTDGSYDSVIYCSVCGEELSRTTITVVAGSHTAGDPVTENYEAPTCTEDGSYDTVVYCTECGEELSRTTITVEATGHTAGEAVVENSVAATCVTAGSYDSVIYCSVCGDEISRETVTVTATGIHTYVLDEDASTAATCTEDGENVYVCSVCGDSYTETVEATGHDYVAVVTAPTCTEGGYTTYTCANCGDSYVADETEATGHSYEATEVVASTYATQGYTVYTCSNCGDSYKADYTDILVLDETDNSLDIRQKVESLTTLPEGLANLYADVEELRNALISQVTVKAGYTKGNTAVYDVTLQYRVDGGAWVDATEDNFPTTGITVTLPYPDGTDSSYDFVVLHMFTVTSERLGIAAGQTEYPTVTKSEDGLVVTLTGLSPVAVAWKEPETTSVSVSTTTTTSSSSSTDSSTSSSTDSSSSTSGSSASSPKTGDEARPVLWMALFLIACGGLAAVAIHLRRKQD